MSGRGARVGERLRRAAGAYDMRSRAVLLCSLPASVSLGLLATLPGVARAPWVPALRLVAVSLVLVVLVLLVRRRLTPQGAALYALYTQGIFAVLALGLADPGLQVLMAVAVLVPPLFVGIVGTPREVAVQVALAVVCAVALTAHLAPPGPSTAPRVLCVVLLVACPSAIVLVMRQQLDDAVRRAERSAVTDPLTGLLNRRGLRDHLPALTDAVVRGDGLLSVLVLDIDRFKAVNDRHGHLRGDEVLRAVATAVRGSCRPGDLVVRHGGEELLVVAQVAGGEDALHLAERVRAAVETGPGQVPVTVSVGVATGRLAPQDVVRTVERLVAEADERMYAAKRGGRNRVEGSALVLG